MKQHSFQTDVFSHYLALKVTTERARERLQLPGPLTGSTPKPSGLELTSLRQTNRAGINLAHHGHSHDYQ